MSRSRGAARLAAVTVAVAVGAFGVTVGPAAAASTVCNNETPLVAGGQDAWVDAGPGVLLVGADVGGVKRLDNDNYVCVASDTAGVNAWVRVDDTPGLATVSRGTGCVADVAVTPTCDVPQSKVYVGDGDTVDALAVSVNGAIVRVVPDGCVAAAGTTCP